MDLIDLADVTGANSVVNLGDLTTIPKVRVIQVVVSGSAATPVRLGNKATVGASRGLPLNSGLGQFLPYAGNLDWWTVPAIAFYVPTGYTLSIALGI